MSRRFDHSFRRATIFFGAGARARLGEALDVLGASKALLLSTPHQAKELEPLATALGTRCVGRFAEVAMHTPVEISERAATLAGELGADVLVAFGGGSTTGLGKAIAYRTDLPQVVIPTTYAGSEATLILGQTEAGEKTTLKNARVTRRRGWTPSASGTTTSSAPRASRPRSPTRTPPRWTRRAWRHCCTAPSMASVPTPDCPIGVVPASRPGTSGTFHPESPSGATANLLVLLC